MSPAGSRVSRRIVFALDYISNRIVPLRLHSPTRRLRLPPRDPSHQEQLPATAHVNRDACHVPNATYRNHGSHSEAIEIEFDPTRLSYRDLLEVFFQIHDPTTLNRQGNDVGTSYRSEIFHVSEAQREEALRTIDDVNASGLWPGRTVTRVSPAGQFWEAEPEHQDYLERYPHGYTCHFPRPGWKLPRRAAAAT